MAKDSRASRLNRRLDALDDIAERRDQGYAKALAALRTAYDAGRRPTGIRIRAPFLEQAQPPLGKPPAARLVNSRGHALQMALLTLYLAQTRKGPPHLLDHPMTAKTPTDLAWEDLIVTSADVGAGSASRRVHQKHANSARNALTRLTKPDISLLELPRASQRKGAYDQVRLLEDSGPRATGMPVTYTVPAPGKDTVTIPIDFFLNGWLYMLEDTEIVTYLMYRRLCALATPAHISADDRGTRYGIKQSAWEQYWVLASSGLVLVKSDENRRADGTYANQSTGSAPRPHLFTLHDAGLTQDALSAVWRAVDQRMSDG